jgi:uncharacterized protein (DUF983 family)
MVKRRGQPQHDNGIDEGPDESDLERFGGVTQSCPKCRAELYDDAEVCWKCGHALHARANTPPPWVVIIAVVLLLIIALGFMLR